MSVRRHGLCFCAAVLLCAALPVVAWAQVSITVEIYGLTGAVLDIKL